MPEITYKSSETEEQPTQENFHTRKHSVIEFNDDSSATAIRLAGKGAGAHAVRIFEKQQKNNKDHSLSFVVKSPVKISENNEKTFFN